MNYLRKSRGLMTQRSYYRRLTIRYLALVAMFIAAIIIAVSIVGEAFAATPIFTRVGKSFWLKMEGVTPTYTVRKGDTLYLIGKRCQKGWKELAAINELLIVYKGNIPYVMIRPGQVLYLEYPKKHINPLEVANYFADTKRWMERKIFRIAGIRDPFPRSKQEVIKFEIPNTPASTQYLRKMIRWIDHQDRYRAVDEIYNEVLARIGDLPVGNTERYWEDHRRACVLLMTLLDAESDGYMVRGKHGEAGRWQVMPKTYCGYKGWPVDAAHQEIAVDILMDSNLEGLRCAIDRLSRKSTVKGALAYYNGYGEDARAYGGRVCRKYLRTLTEADRYGNPS